MFVLYESIFQHPFFYKFLPSLTYSRRGLYIFTNVFIKEECGNMDSFFSTTQLLPVCTTWRLQPEINTHFLATSRKPPGIVFLYIPNQDSRHQSNWSWVLNKRNPSVCVLLCLASFFVHGVLWFTKHVSVGHFYYWFYMYVWINISFIISHGMTPLFSVWSCCQSHYYKLVCLFYRDSLALIIPECISMRNILDHEVDRILTYPKFPGNAPLFYTDVYSGYWYSGFSVDVHPPQNLILRIFLIWIF